MSWDGVLGRVSFINCDPVFHTIPDSWKVLSAPPSWLTGHLLRRDCITAPIPTADYASNLGELSLISILEVEESEGNAMSLIVSMGLFPNRRTDPTDSRPTIPISLMRLSFPRLDA